MASWISTGHLPTEAVVRQLVDEAHQRFGPVREGKVARYIPALASANPARPDFNPSPESTRYFTGGELISLIHAHGYSPELFAGFPLARQSAKGQWLQALQRWAVKLHLMPKTMAGKELLKRLMFGKLLHFPADVTAAAGTSVPPIPMTNPAAADTYKVIYAVARKGASV